VDSHPDGTGWLPRRLVAQGRWQRPPPDGTSLLFTDLSLLDLARQSVDAVPPLAVDIDTVAGLAPDGTSVAFLVERLGVAIVITRRPALAVRAQELGCVALLHVHCLDSTGLERGLSTHPGRPVGTAVSPGIILAHLDPAERRVLPRPLLAYGLLRSGADREAALAAGADAVVTMPHVHP
jgi:glycerol-3-phosphate responsive antiterminator